MTTSSIANPLPLPPFFNPDNAKSWDYAPDHNRMLGVAADWRKVHSILPAGPFTRMDGVRFDNSLPDVRLLGIDLAKDFGHPKGSLYVGGRSGNGGMEDSARIATFIYKFIWLLTKIILTFDTHPWYAIFFPTLWLKADGTPADAHTMISNADLRAGKYRLNPAVAAILARAANGSGNLRWLEEYADHYTKTLESEGKYMLYLWTMHCLFGTPGHNLMGVIEEAAYFHAACRQTQLGVEVKGTNPLSERYSIFKEEVMTRHDNKPLDGAQRNVKLIRTLLEADKVIIVGEAASHCVKSSIDDLLDEILVMDPSLAKKVVIFEDCMSSVVVPGGPDFTDDAQKALERFSKAGMKIARSTDPISSWL